tara:strand:- start:371 stop:736 length:366 start_codon:yes stop_codon:yes gene_type:complete
MAKRSEQKQRAMFWALFVVSLILIVFGYWKVNGKMWQEFGKEAEKSNQVGQELVDSLMEIRDQAQSDLEVVQDEMIEDFEEMARDQQEVMATDVVIDNMVNELDLETSENYAEEENGQEGN